LKAVGKGFLKKGSSMRNLFYPPTEAMEMLSRGRCFFLCVGIIAFVLCNKNNPVDNSNDNFTFGSLTDIDGNVYKTIQICDQEWTVENLRTIRYNDGTPITLDTSAASWASATTGEYCYYKNTINSDSIKKFGALYNWAAVNTKKLAPLGWHVPTDSEWNSLKNCLIANGYNFDSSTMDNIIAKSLAAKTDWHATSTPGAVGNDLSKNNRSGFSGLPSGYRSPDGAFYNICIVCYWWSATQYPGSSDAFYWGLYYDGTSLLRDNDSQRAGLSVRLVRNN
jgi:uncharacterized protein (TIGR02145 family)